MKRQTGAEMKQKTCRIIINADDFGQTESCTKAIYEAFESGLITDTTMVANGDAMELAFTLASKMQGRVGVHLNLTEGTALTPEIQQNPKFVSHGRFTDYFKGRGTYFLHLSKKDRQDLYTELTAQVDRLMDEGIEISHVDSHHHIHCNWMLAPIIFRVCREHSIYRIRCHKNVAGRFRLWNGLYARLYRFRLRWSGFRFPDHFESIRMYEKPLAGISEMMVHPDYNPDGILIDRQKKEHLPDGQIIAQGQDLESLIRKHSGNAQKIKYDLL